MSLYEFDQKKEPWWRSPKEDVHSAVFEAVETLDQTQEYRRASNLHHLRMYSNRAASGLTGKSYAMSASSERLRWNLVRAVVDAAVAQLATNRPRPFYQVANGDYTTKNRAKNMGKFMMGQFYSMNLYDLGLDVFHDACVFGAGFVGLSEDGGHIQAERVFPDEVLVDDDEARLAMPRQMFRHKDVNREIVLDQFPKHADEIRQSGRVRDMGYTDSLADRISVVEAWHLPSGKDADDGRHVVCVSGAALVDEPYKKDSFPIKCFRWNKDRLGFFGTGIAEELSSLQVEINYLLGKIQELFNLATTQIWTRKGEGISKISNKNMGIHEYTNTPPTVLSVRPADPAYFQQLESLWAKGFQMTGISQLAAMSQKPAGLNSGTALRTYNDIGNRRFQHVMQRWENFIVRDVGEFVFDLARDIKERGDGDIKVLAQGDKEIEELKFSEVALEKNKYTVKVFPTSLLPDTPSGKLQAIQDMAQAIPGIQEYLLYLFDVPDLDGIRDVLTADIQLVEKQIEAILDRGEPQQPLPFMNLQQAIKHASLNILKAERDGVDEERIDLLRQYADSIEYMIEKASQPAQAAAPGPQGPAPAQPAGQAMMPAAMAGLPPTQG